MYSLPIAQTKLLQVNHYTEKIMIDQTKGFTCYDY